MSRYVIPTNRPSFHNSFDRDRPPVLTIEPGDTVVLQTLDASWGRNGGAHGLGPEWLTAAETTEPGHALTGPIYVRGAEPGDALQVAIDNVVPVHWGWTWAGPRPWNQRYSMDLDEEVLVLWDFDLEHGRALDRNGPGVSVPLRPFLGVMGNALSEPGRHPTAPPRRVGGNLDCRELVAGSELLLPVEVDGALFSAGDGHAAQADGELAQTAIECAMERVELTFRVLKVGGDTLRGPQASTPAGYVCMAVADTLDAAAPEAVAAMLDYLQRTHGLSRAHAMVLATVAVEMRVTQVVNGVVGVHALLRWDAFEIERISGSARFH